MNYRLQHRNCDLIHKSCINYLHMQLSNMNWDDGQSFIGKQPRY